MREALLSREFSTARFARCVTNRDSSSRKHVAIDSRSVMRAHRVSRSINNAFVIRVATRPKSCQAQNRSSARKIPSSRRIHSAQAIRIATAP